MDSFNNRGQGCDVKEDEFENQFLSDNDLPHEGSGMTKCADTWGSYDLNPHEIRSEASSRTTYGSSSNENVNICKTTLTYKSDNAKNKYFIPKVDTVSDDELWVDKRSSFEIFRDVTLKFFEIIKPSLKELWEQICAYRIDRPQFSSTGFSATKEQMRLWIKEFRDNLLSDKNRKLKYEALANLEKESPHIFPEPDFITEGEPEHYSRKEISTNACIVNDDKCQSACYLPCGKHCKKHCAGECVFDTVLNQFPPCKCPLSTRNAPKNPQERNKLSKSLNTSDIQFYKGFIEKESLTAAERRFVDRLCNKNIPNLTMKKKFVQLLLKYHVLRCHECDCSNSSLIEAAKDDIKCQKCVSRVQQSGECTETDTTSEIKVNITASQTPYVNVYLKHNNNLSAPMNALIDTGSDASLLPMFVLKSIGLDMSCLRKSHKSTITTADGNKRKCILGEAQIPIFFMKNNIFYRTTAVFLITDEDFGMPNNQCILGSDFFKQQKMSIEFDKMTISLDVQAPSLKSIRLILPYVTPGQQSYQCKVQRVKAVSSSSVRVDCETGHIPHGRHYHVSCPGTRQTDIVYITKNKPDLLKNVNGQEWPACVFEENISNVNTGPWPADKIIPKIINEEFCNLTFKSCHGNECQECNNLMTSPDYEDEYEILRSAQNFNNNNEKHDDKNKNAKMAEGQNGDESENTAKSQTVASSKHELQNECQIHSLHLDICKSHTCNKIQTTDYCPCPIKNEIYNQDSMTNNENMEEIEKEIVKCNKVTQTSENTVTPPEEDIDTKFLETDDLCKKEEGKDTIQTDHLEKELKEKMKELIKEYKEAFATKQKKTGTFKYFEVSVSIDAPESASQKNRNVKFLPAAEKKINEMLDQDLLRECTHKPHLVSNFVQVLKPIAGKHLRNASKADKQQLQHQSEKMLKQGHEQPVRLTCDFSVLNKYSSDRIQVSLPKLSDIKEMCADSYCSSFDASDGYHSIKLSEESKKYFALYFNNKLLEFTRLPQGYSASPFFFCEAMSATFSEEVFNEFKKTKKLTDKDLPFKNYSEFCRFYIDDIVLATKKTHGRQTHVNAIESVLFAIQRSGLLLAPAKAQIFARDILFLGQQINVDKNYTTISDERIEAILNYRTPRSKGEAASRLGAFHFSAEHLLFARTVSLPIHHMINKSDKFYWDQGCSEAWSELKLLACLQLRSAIFNPDEPSFLCCDASKVAAAYSFFQIDPDGTIRDIQTNSQLLSPAEFRKPSVAREASALGYSLKQCEHLILASNASVTILSDCSALQYISRQKSHHSKYFELAIGIAKHKNLEVLYLPGKFLFRVDAATRQFQQVFLKNPNKLSEKFSRLVYPMDPNLKDKIMKLNNEELIQFMMDERPPEYWDLYDKRNLYEQPGISSTDLNERLKVTADEQLLAAWLREGFNAPFLLKFPLVRDLMKNIQNQSKLSLDKLIRELKLTNFQKKLSSLGFDSHTYFRHLKENPKSKGRGKNKSSSQNNQSPTREDSRENETKINAIVTRGQARKNQFLHNLIKNQLKGQEKFPNNFDNNPPRVWDELQKQEEYKKKKFRNYSPNFQYSPPSPIKISHQEAETEIVDIEKKQKAKKKSHEKTPQNRPPPLKISTQLDTDKIKNFRNFSPPLTPPENFSPVTKSTKKYILNPEAPEFKPRKQIEKPQEPQHSGFTNYSPISTDEIFSYPEVESKNNSIEQFSDHATSQIENKLKHSSKDVKLKERKFDIRDYKNQESEFFNQNENRIQEFTNEKKEIDDSLRKLKFSHKGIWIKPDVNTPTKYKDTNLKFIPCVCHPKEQLIHIASFIMTIQRVNSFMDTLNKYLTLFTKADERKCKTMIREFKSTGCFLKKYNIFITVLQEFYTQTHNMQLDLTFKDMDKGDTQNLKFYIFAYESDYVTTEFSHNEIKFLAKKNIESEPFQYHQLPVQVLLKADGNSTLELRTIEDYFTEPNYMLTDYFIMSHIIILNLRGQQNKIQKNEILFKIYFDDSIQHLPIILPLHFLKSKQNLLNNMKIFDSQAHMSKIFLKYFDYIQDIPGEKSSDPLGIYNEQEGDYQVTAAGSQMAAQDSVDMSMIHVQSASTDTMESSSQQPDNENYVLSGDHIRAINQIIQVFKLQKTGNTIMAKDMEEIQRCCQYLIDKIRKCKASANGQFRQYHMQNGLLFYTSMLKDNVVIDRLCIPDSLCSIMANNYHNYHNSHIPASSLEKMLNQLFYCRNMGSICKDVIKRCTTCLLNTEHLKYKIKGSEKSTKELYRSNQVWELDNMYLPPSVRSKYKMCLVCVDRMSGYVNAFPLKSSATKDVEEAVYNLFLAHGCPQVINCDASSEWKGALSQLCLQNHVLIKTSHTRRSDANPQVEKAIHLIKRELTKILHSTVPDLREKWYMLLPQITNYINMQKQYGSFLSKRECFYSPLVWSNTVMQLELEDHDKVPEFHWLNLNRLRRIRDRALKKDMTNATLKSELLQVGQICKHLQKEQDQKTHSDHTRSLLRPTVDIVKIIGFAPGRLSANCRSLLNNTQKNISILHLKKLLPEDFLNLRFRAQNLFKHITSAQVNQRYKHLAKSTSFLPETHPGYSLKYGAETEQQDTLTQQEVEENINNNENVQINHIQVQNYEREYITADMKSVLKVKKNKELSFIQQSKEYQRMTPNQIHALSAANYLENELGYEETIDIKALANAEPLAPSQLYFATDENIVKSNSQKRIHFSKGTNMNANRHCTDICVYSIISQCFAVQNSLSLQEMSLLL